MVGWPGCRAMSVRRFFFSSRRRHTRSKRDWSQTCALPILADEEGQRHEDSVGPELPLSARRVGVPEAAVVRARVGVERVPYLVRGELVLLLPRRSEERRVGKECIAGWSRV